VIEDEATGWYCYTAIHFVGEDALIAYCAGDTETIGGLNRVRITRLPLQWLYG